MQILSRIPLHRKGLIYISLTAFLWSSSGLFIKVLTLNAFQISFFRSSVAAVTLAVITFLKYGRITPDRDIRTILAAVFYAGILIFFVAANKLTTSANAIFIQFTAPIYLLFLEPIVLKTQFKKRDLFTIIVCTSGMALFFAEKLEIGSLYGNLIAILAGICFALFSLFIKWNRSLGRPNTIISIIYGNILVSLICLPMTIGGQMPSAAQGLILLYMGAIQIGLSYFIFNIGIKYVSATESMIIAMLEAIFNPVWVFLGVGEVPSFTAVSGGLIIFAAVIIHGILSDREKASLPSGSIIEKQKVN